MKLPSKTASPAAELRHRAERRLREQSAKAAHTETQANGNRILQELQIHQIELEMQNEELKQAKAALDAGLEKYTDLYDFAPVGYFTLTANGTIHKVNLTGTSLVGMDRTQLVGRRFGLLLASGLRPAFNTFLTRVFVDETTQSQDFELLREGQPSLIVNIEARRMLNGVECHAVVLDITERKHAEDNVLVSEVRYRRLFEAAKDGVLLLDPATRKITDANPFMTKLLGCSHDELVGKELFEIGLLKDAAASKKMFLELKRQHQVRYDDLPLKSETVRHQEVEVVASLYEENGQSVIQCIIRDITKRKQVEDILRRNEALFSALLNHAPIGVYVLDDQFRMVQINPKALPAFSKIRPLLGRDFSEVIHILWPKRVADATEKRFRHTLKTGEPYQSPEFVERRKDTRVKEAYEWQIQRVTLPNGDHRLVCFFNDITERKRAEEDKLRLEVLTASNAKLKLEIIRRQAVEAALTKSEQLAQELLKQSRQLQRKLRESSHQNLLALENQRKEISHELHDKISQVLIGINVRLSVFTRTAAVNPRAIAPVRQLVEKSVKIVHDYARELRPAMLDQLGLIPAIRTYIDEIPKRKGCRIHFSASASASAGVEALDNDKRTVLYRVAQEALVNVAKHARARNVNVTLRQARGGVCLEVTDDGKAFDVDLLSSPQWSHRLGLTGMRERVEMVNGVFSIISTPGKGTTIRAVIPVGKSKRRK